MRRMRVNEQCTDFIQSIVQSRYPKIRENSQQTSEKTKPIHDINSHYRTALEYFVDNEPEMVMPIPQSQQYIPFAGEIVHEIQQPHNFGKPEFFDKLS